MPFCDFQFKYKYTKYTNANMYLNPTLVTTPDFSTTDFDLPNIMDVTIDNEDLIP